MTGKPDALGEAVDNRFRTYDPAIGRYVSANPVGQYGAVAGDGGMPESFMQPGSADSRLFDLLESGAHPYTYSQNDPVGAGRSARSVWLHGHSQHSAERREPSFCEPADSSAMPLVLGA